MSEFRIESNVSCFNEEVLREYADVYFHCEDSTTIEGHMALIAPLSPFCHKFFRTRKNAKVVDMFFPQIRRSVIQNAVMIMYGKVVHVPKSDTKRVQSFLNLLQVKYKVESTLDISQEKMDEETASAAVSGDDDQGPPVIDIDTTFKADKTKEKNPAQFGTFSRPESHASSSDKSSLKLGQGPSSSDVDLDNWSISATETDIEKIDDISHTIERGDGNERKRYKCKLCPSLSPTFYLAVQHFKKKHQDLDNVADVIANVDLERKKVKKDFEDLSKSKVNIRVMEHECSNIVDKLQTLVSDLESLPSTSIPIQQLKKKQEYLKKLKMDINSVDIFMKNI